MAPLTRISIVIVAVSLAYARCTAADDETSDTDKPAIRLHDDGFPTGHSTPEGVACDLARAFITRDANLFSDVCIKPLGGGESRAAYEKFLKQTSDSIEAESNKDKPSPGGPKRIGKVFGARHLSLNGSASTAWAIHGLHDVTFVDVGTFLHNGKRYLNRTLVLKSANGDWYALPYPRAYPLLSAGLNDESDSKKDYTKAYSIPPPDAK